MIARRSFTFYAVPTSPETKTIPVLDWTWHLYIYKGRFGRFEAWNPKDPSLANVPKQIGKFPDTGTHSYTFEGITIDNVKYNQDSKQIKFFIGKEGNVDYGARYGIVRIQLIGDEFKNVTLESTLLITFKQAAAWIPWIWYKNVAEFNYDPRKGLIDQDATPARSIGLAQDIDMEMNTLAINALPVMVHGSLIAFAAYIAILGWLVDLDTTQKGKGIVKIINYSEPVNQTNISGGLIQRRSPQAIIGYRYNVMWYLTASFMEIAGPSLTNVVNLGESLTQEQFLLKYQDLSIIQLFIYSIYAFLPYLGYIEKQISVPTDYRINIEGISWSDKPCNVDRLVQLSKINSNNIYFPDLRKSIIVPDNYTDIIDEFNDINGKIKINKLVNLKNIKLGSREDIGDSSYRQNDTLTGLYPIIFDKDNDELKTSYEQLRNSNKEYTELMSEQTPVNINFYVYLEKNIATDLSSIQSNVSYNICGKLLNISWLYACNDFFSNRHIIENSKFWQWISLSEDLVKILKNNFKSLPGSFVLVVRGRGAQEQEKVLKYPTNDFITQTPPSGKFNYINPDTNNGYVLSTTSDLPLINIMATVDDSNVSEEDKNNIINKPLQIQINYENYWSANRTYEYILAEKLLLPGQNTIYYNYNDDFLVPLIPSDPLSKNKMVKYLIFNYPEIGFAREYQYGSKKFSVDDDSLPRLGFKVDALFTTTNWIFQVLRNNEAFPSQTSWTPLLSSIDDLESLFYGITLNEEYDSSKYTYNFFMRVLNTSASFVAGSPNSSSDPLKRADKINIKLKNSSENIKFKVAINQGFDFYNLETVGVNRMEKYMELVPGKGLKTTSGHGVSFQQSASGQEIALSGKINGLFNFPVAAIDAYGENAIDDNEEANGIAYLHKDAEIFANTNLWFSGGILNFYSLTDIIEEEQPLDLRINAFYDNSADQHVIIYTKLNNIIYVRYSSFEWSEPCYYKVLLDRKYANEPQNRSFPYNYYNHTLDNAIYLGKAVELPETISNSTSKNYIVENLVTSGDQKITGYLSDGTEVTIVSSYLGVEIKFPQQTIADCNVAKIACTVQNNTPIPGKIGELSTTVFVTVKYALWSNQSEQFYFGYKNSLNYTRPRYYILHSGNTSIDANGVMISTPSSPNIIDVPIITNPSSILIEICIPPGLTQEEFNLYKTSVQETMFSINGVYTVTSDQVINGSASSIFKSKSREFFAIYSGKKLFDDAGKEIIQTSTNQISNVQIIGTQDNFKHWGSPKCLVDSDPVKLSQADMDANKTRLKEAGFTDEQITSILRETRYWDRPMNIATLSNPTFLYDNFGHRILIFGFAGSNLVLWRIPELLLDPKLTFTKAEAYNLGGFIYSDKDKTLKDKPVNIIDTNVPSKMIAPIILKHDNLLVFYEDSNGNIKSKISSDHGNTWKDTQLILFRKEAYFKNALNVQITPDNVAELIHIFGMTYVSESSKDFHLYMYSLPQRFFTTQEPDKEAEQTEAANQGGKAPPTNIEIMQKYIDEKPKILVIGDPNSVPLEEYSQPPQKTIIGNARYSNGVWVNLPPYTNFSELSIDSPGKEKEIATKENNIKVRYFISSYVDRYGRIRMYYYNELFNIACKISTDKGLTWSNDYSV